MAVKTRVPNEKKLEMSKIVFDIIQSLPSTKIPKDRLIFLIRDKIGSDILTTNDYLRFTIKQYSNQLSQEGSFINKI